MPVDQQSLVDQARAGDLSAFAHLTERYHAMVLAYAYALLGDYHAAQDIAQETFLITYFNLSKLRDGRAFPGWLRGITRHQCSRLRRQRRVDLVPLEAALEVMAPSVPERVVEESEGLSSILRSIAALSHQQREVAALYFIKDYSRQEIAAFLGLPVTTVTNRLYAARVQLKDALRVPASGQIVAVRGPVVDVAFAPDDTPRRLTHLAVGAEGDRSASSLMVADDAEGGVVRCVALSAPIPLLPGMMVRETGRPISMPVPPAILGDALTLLRGGPLIAPPQVQETGIKVIDLLCPCAVGGMIGLVGDYGAGKSVVMAELLHTIALTSGALSIVAFLSQGREVVYWHDLADPIPRTATLRPIYIAVADPCDTDSPPGVAAATALDALVYLSRPLIPQGLYPAVDPLRSTSRLLDPAIVGRAHYEVAHAVRDTLRRDGAAAADGSLRTLVPVEATRVARARKLRLFLTQPFFIAAPYTHKPGQFVPRQETVRVCRGILDGVYDHLPEDAFYLVGGLDAARAGGDSV